MTHRAFHHRFARRRIRQRHSRRTARRRLRVEQLTNRLCLATLVVNTAADLEDQVDDGVVDVDPNTPGEQLSLREAIKLANSETDADILRFELAGEHTLSVGSQLPAITQPLTIEASEHIGNQPVTLTTTSDGEIHGLVVQSDGVVISGLDIVGFGGHGIAGQTAVGTLVLNEVSIRDNAGFAVVNASNLRMNRATDVVADDPRSEIRGNGAGGIFVHGSFQSDRQIVIEDNQGVGLFARLDVTMFGGVTSSGNAGTGIQSFEGEIEINRGVASDDVPVVIVSNNGGPGFLAGDAIFADGKRSIDPDAIRPRNVAITTSAVIEGNAGWGVMAPHGSVFINTVNVLVGGSSQLRSSVSDNGSSRFSDITFVNDQLEQATLPDPRYESRGGVWAAGSIVTAKVDVRGNAGAGLLGNQLVHVISPVIEDNLGPGIQTVDGDVDIVANQVGFETHIRRNAGPGIVAGAFGDTLEDVIEAPSPARGAINISGPVQVTENAGWGLLANRTVNINVFEGDTRPTLVSGNGDTTRPVFMYSRGEGTAFEAPHESDNGGGIATADLISSVTGLGAFRLVVTDNFGPGIVAGSHIDLFVPQVTGNHGPGIQSIVGSVTVRPTNIIGDRGIAVSRNQGAGIRAGQDIVLETGHIEVLENAHWGLSAGRDLKTGQSFIGGPLVASENGDPDTGPAFTVTSTGTVRELDFDERDEAGGLLALRDVQLQDVFSTNNFGDGLRAERDLRVERGQFCLNTDEQVGANGIFDLIDVVDCEAIVRNTRDSGFGSLRNAVMIGGSVAFDMESLGPGPHTITLESEIVGEQSVFVNGPGADVVTVSGNGNNRLFSLADPDGNELGAEFTNLTFKDGNAEGDEGGAIRTQATFLRLSDMVFEGNRAGRGGAVAMLPGDSSGYGGSSGSAELVVEDSLFSNNSADDGGAIWAQTPVNIEDSTLESNSANFNGGAVYLESDQFFLASFRRDTFSDNRAIEGDGGALWIATDADILTDVSTFSGNSAGGSGGAIFHQDSGGTTRYIHVTVTDNRADADGDGNGSGGGIINEGFGQVTAEFSILAGNFAGIGTLADDAMGVESTDVNLIGGDARLAPLADNGGTTRTHAVLPDSPAIDAAVGSIILRDQRGIRRNFQGDLGAYERASDFGDAPASFPVFVNDVGASHIIGSLTLGPRIDGELDGQPSFDADGDDSEFTDDEDGVEIRPVASTFSARTFVTASGAGLLNAWIDFNVDGDWDDVGEQIFVDVPVVEGVNAVDFAVPDVAELLQVEELDEPVVTFARFRLSTQSGLTPTGPAPDGEVEDRQLLIGEAVISLDQIFEDTVLARVPTIYDPEVAVGYVYEVSSGPAFATMELLPGFGDDIFTLGVDDGEGGFNDVLTFEAGQPIDFETDPRLQLDGGTHRFRITGIEMDADIDPDNPLGFPTVLSFAEDGEVVFSQRPLVSPTAVDDLVTAEEDRPVSVSAAAGLLANDTDPDVGDALHVSAVDGVATAVGQTLNLTSGARLTVEADGSFTYDPNDAFEFLGVDDSHVDYFTYQVSDSFGGNDEAVVAMFVEGANDLPSISITGLPDEITEGSAVAINGAVQDPDADDTYEILWSVTKNDEPFDEGTGDEFAFTPDDNGEYSITAVVTDAVGAIGTGTITTTALNGPPSVDLQVPDRVIAGQPATFVLVATDPSPVDNATEFTFEIDWDGDGTFDETFSGPRETQVSHVVAAGTSSTEVFVRTYDKDGAVSDTTSRSIEVESPPDDSGSAFLQNGDLIVNGTDRDDRIVIYRSRRGNGGSLVVRINDSVSGSFAPTGIVRVHAGDGDDIVRIQSNVPNDTVVNGGVGNDYLVGGGGSNTLHGGTGDDTLRASLRDDWLDGGPGNDQLFAGTGSDTLLGGADDDRLLGHRGSDRLHGGEGNDRIKGGSDGDLIDGGSGNDILQGGVGHDLIRGGDGDDSIRGGGGRDILLGGAGDDVILARHGRDLLIGGSGSDSLRGGGGQDVIVSGTTGYDDNDEALAAILREWASSQDLAERIANLQLGQGSLTGLDIRLDSETTRDDDALDRMFGESQADFFLANILGVGALDFVRDDESPDVVRDVD